MADNEPTLSKLFCCGKRRLNTAMNNIKMMLRAIGASCLISTTVLAATPSDDAKAVGDLDTQFQAAVKANDVGTMGRILADDMVLVTGRGHTFGKAAQLEEARTRKIAYEKQEEEAGTQKVRVWGDMAVVTALLWIKDSSNGTPKEYRLWFSDIYFRTPSGWRYTFGQASLPLPPPAGTAR
jgi:ketosteroid isomerase-like protein